MSVMIPFNNQPTSVAVKTSSYGIPAGSYAFVTVSVENGGLFTIDGSTAMTSEAKLAAAVSAVSQQSSINTINNYAVTSGYYFEGYCTQPSGTLANVSIGGTVVGKTTTATSSVMNTFRAGGGDTISIAGVAGVVTSITGYVVRAGIQQTENTASFWLPTGTTIAGSGSWQATVSLYNELS